MELRPFKDAIAKGVSNIMTAHIIFKKVDPENPASISKKILKDILYFTSKYLLVKIISKGIKNLEQSSNIIMRLLIIIQLI